MYLCLCVGIVYMSVGIHRGQKRKLDLLELELQMAMNCFTWVLGTKLTLTPSTQVYIVTQGDVWCTDLYSSVLIFTFRDWVRHQLHPYKAFRQVLKSNFNHSNVLWDSH